MVGQASRYHELTHRHARPFKRARRQLKFQHTQLGWIAPFVQNHSEIARPLFEIAIKLLFCGQGMPWGA